MTDFLVKLLLLGGAFFIMSAGIGLLRLPDFYMRNSALAKAMTLGIGLLLLAMAVRFWDFTVSARAALVIVFFAITSPVAAHRIARAAFLAGVPLWRGSVVNELEGRYNSQTRELSSSPPGSEKVKSADATSGHPSSGDAEDVG